MLNKITIVILISSVYLGSVNTFYKYYKADTYYKAARGEISEGKSTKALELTNKAINNNPNEPAYYRERAKAYLVTTLEQSKKGQKKLALKDLNKAVALNPNNLATIRNSTPTYYYLAVDDLAKPESLENLDPEYVELIGKYLDKYKKDYKNDVGVQVLVAKYERKLGLEENYKETTERIELLRPKLLEWQKELL